MWKRLVIAFALCLSVTPVAADTGKPVEDAPPEAAPKAEPETVTRARALFVEGADLAKKALWGDALARFEASAALRGHAGTSYNVGICQRALGRYTLARVAFRKALEQNNDEATLAPSVIDNIRGYLHETEGVLAELSVTLQPPEARLSVDGRPLDNDNGTRIAGLLPPGPGTSPQQSLFTLVLDPGTHVFVVSGKGFSDVVVRKTVAPGSRGTLDLTLARLPADLRVASNEPNAAVSLDGIDVGLAPVVLQRPAGSYTVVVRKEGFEDYNADVTLRAAEQFDLVTQLQPETIGVHERWWFWASLGTVLATTIVVTYALTRPEPERPPLDGGGLGWTVPVP